MGEVIFKSLLEALGKPIGRFFKWLFEEVFQELLQSLLASLGNFFWVLLGIILVIPYIVIRTKMFKKNDN
jgi:hypothetical protein